MKHFYLVSNIESNYHSPPRQLNGKATGNHGTAFWSPSHNSQVCRVPAEKWNLKIHADIELMGVVPGNKWAVTSEFVCEDGAAFELLADAERHEDEMRKLTETEPTDEITAESLTELSKGKGGYFRLRAFAIKRKISCDGSTNTAAMLEMLIHHFNLQPLAAAS